MSKPVELDSDDEAIEEAKRLATRQGLSVPPQNYSSSTSRQQRDEDDDDDAQSIRSRLSAFEMQDREVDKLQLQQRRRLDRHLSYRSSAAANANANAVNRSGSGSGAGVVHPDLQDLAFGSTGSS